MAKTQPPDTRPGFGRAGALLKFAAALLASLGIGSLVELFRKRARMKAAEQDEQRKAEREAEIARMRERGHEPEHLRVRPIIWLLVAAGAGAVVIGLALFGLISYFAAREQRADVPLSPLVSTQQLPPEPRLQVNPAADWQRLRATDEALLGSYGWVAQPGGAVRIPIDRAMDLLAQRGLPARNGGQPDAAYDQAHNLESMGGQPPAPPTPAPLGQPGSPTAVRPTATATPSAATQPTGAATQPTGAATPSATAVAQPTGAAGSSR